MKPMYAVLACGLLSACGGSGSSSSDFVEDVDESRSGAAAVEEVATASEADYNGLFYSDAAHAATDIDLVSLDDTDFASLFNNMRVSNGLGTVSWDARLNAAAQKHAEDMLDNGYFSHVGLDGSTVLDRIRAEGYDPSVYGENLGRGQQDQQEILNAWIDSKDHNVVLNISDVEDFALGVAGSGSQLHWVLVVGAE